MARGYPDYEGDKSKLFTVADWAAIEATDKNFEALLAGAVYADQAIVLYTVPPGRTLYITQFGFSSYASVAADGDNNQICRGLIYNLTLFANLWVTSGNGGDGLMFPKPLVVEAGHQVGFYSGNFSNHTCVLQVAAGGYEV